MDNNLNSLIWDTEDDRKGFSSETFVDDLKINYLIDVNIMASFNSKKFSLSDFFTLNKKTIKRRNELFSDLLKYRNLLPQFKNILRLLSDFSQLGMNSRNGGTVESNLYSVKEISMYTDIIEGLHCLFDGVDVESAALNEFISKIKAVYNSEDFTYLVSGTKKLDSRVNKIKSVTVGVNLNSQLQPVEAGIVGINDEPFLSGNIIDKLLRAEIGKNDYSCIAPLEPVSKGLNVMERSALTTAINNGLNTVFSKALSSWKDTVRRYTQTEVAWLYYLIPEFNFIIGGMDFLLKLSDSGLPLCSPVFSSAEHIQDLYDPNLVTNGEAIVKNDISFDGEGQIYILTGPNQGGKSVFTRAVGVFYAILHLGILLPASSARVRGVDNIFTHFPSKSFDSYQKGRFATECSAISAISKVITEKSLFLFDESLSSTSNFEATHIAEEILLAYSCIGCKGIFTTHLHDLCNYCEEINKNDAAKSLCALLTAELSVQTNERTYKIVKGHSYGMSFAGDIAAKYGLDHKTLLAEHVDKPV